MLEAPVNRDPSRLPGFEDALTEAFDVSRRIPVLEKLAGENVPRTRDPCLTQHGINNRLQACYVVRVVAVNEVVLVRRVNRFVFCRIVLRGHLTDGLLRDPHN